MNWFRPHISHLVAYSSARDEYTGKAGLFLDANENPFPQAFNRYPDPHQKELKEALAKRKGLATEQIFIGNGSDEAIDLLIRACCSPQVERICICSPTYSMYAVSARLQNVEIVDVPLSEAFQLNTQSLIEKAKDCPLIFLCSPNNPSGNLLHREDIIRVLENCSGLVVIDEAYIDFADVASWTEFLSSYSNLIVLQTFSKAWGLAGLRLGVAYAQPQIIQVLNTLKPPYNVSDHTQQKGLESLDNELRVQNEVMQLVEERKRVARLLNSLHSVLKVFPSDANFLLFQVSHASTLYNFLLERGIVLRNRSQIIPNTLRVSIGTPSENDYFISQMKQYEKDIIY